jgi:KUP system potassium uptake protein
MEQPNVMRALAQCADYRLHFDPLGTSFVIGRDKLRARGRSSSLSRWRQALFILMSNNSADATEFFAIPVNRVVELGAQVEI